MVDALMVNPFNHLFVCNSGMDCEGQVARDATTALDDDGARNRQPKSSIRLYAMYRQIAWFLCHVLIQVADAAKALFGWRFHILGDQYTLAQYVCFQ
jgi:hypothetical protein